MDKANFQETSIYFYTTILFAVVSIITLVMYSSTTTICTLPTTTTINTVLNNKKLAMATVDLQFSEQNFPSVVYDDIFTGNNVWQGGYNILNTGKSSANKTQNGISSPIVSVSGYVRSG
jgi:hypothetical protein